MGYINKGEGNMRKSMNAGLPQNFWCIISIHTGTRLHRNVTERESDYYNLSFAGRQANFHYLRYDNAHVVITFALQNEIEELLRCMFERSC